MLRAFNSHCEGGYCAPNIKSTERLGKYYYIYGQAGTNSTLSLDLYTSHTHTYTRARRGHDRRCTSILYIKYLAKNVNTICTTNEQFNVDKQNEERHFRRISNFSSRD